MFPIFEAIAFENIELPGGSTRPLVFTVNTDCGYRSYVVKIFSCKDRDQYNPMAKECFAYALAEEFSLQQPDAAIIRFSEDLLAFVDKDVSNRIKDSGSLFHYGTLLMDGYSIFNHNLRLSDLLYYEIESIFAFDLLIFNVDRRKAKPNLIIKGKEYLLLDHELSLTISETFLANVRVSDFSHLYNNPVFKQHIFLPPLKKLNKKLNIRFETFEYHLSSLNLNKLHDVKQVLDEIHINSDDYSVIKSYIAEIKSKSGTFVKMLSNFF